MLGLSSLGVAGAAGAAVAAVAATLQNGWVVAWWPGSQQLTSAQLTTPTGTQAQTFPQADCAVHNCSSGAGADGGAPGGGPGGG